MVEQKTSFRPKPGEKISELEKLRKTTFLQRRSYFPLFVLIFIVLFGYEIVPYYQKSSLDQVLASKDVTQLKSVMMKSMIPGASDIQIVTIPLSQLVEGSISIMVKGGEDHPVAELSTPRISIRYDRLILYVGTFGFMLLLLRSMWPSLMSAKTAGIRNTKDIAGLDQTIEKVKVFGENAIDVLEEEVLTAQKRAEDLYNRSTLLLAGGIILAFIGVGIFYVSLPNLSDRQEITLTGYLAQSIKPTSVLLFIEAIAWFLLRQYRALIEDYKSFHRMYLKRANYLISFKTLASDSNLETNLFLITSLLNEDLTGRLREGETTEALESAKVPELNPVFLVLNSLIEKIPGSVRKKE